MSTVNELIEEIKKRKLIPYDGYDKKLKQYPGDRCFYYVDMDENETGKISILKNKLIYPCKWTNDDRSEECYYFVQPDRQLTEDGYIIKNDVGQDDIKFEDRAILPRILKMLLDRRKATKKKMKKEKDPFQKQIYDGLQLAYKVTANSIYGACGASVGAISYKPVAASVTTTGRDLLVTSRDKVLDYYKGSQCVYGDSVTGDTPILIRYPNSKISIKTIETMHNDWKPYEEFKPFDTNRKEKQQSLVNLECWANNSWAKIKS